jgi:hypothetical protein
MKVKVEYLTDFWAQGSFRDVTNRAMVGTDGKAILVFEVAKIIDGLRVSISKAVSVTVAEDGESGTDYGERLAAEMTETLDRLRL